MTFDARHRLLVVLVTAVLALGGCGGGSGGGSVPGPAPPPPPAQPTLTALAHQPPVGVFLAILLTDGTVMVQANPFTTPGTSAGNFYRLTPDAKGDYGNGTWSALASPPTGYAPYASGEAVLADGRVIFVGGEYNQDNYALPFAPSALTNMSSVYDPAANAWTMILPPPGLAYIGDVSSVVLPSGLFVFGDKLGKDMWALDPLTLTWTALASAGKNDNFAEEGFTLLPSGAVMTVDMVDTPMSEHYAPTTDTWIQDGATPAVLTTPTTVVGGLTYGPAPVQVVGGVSYGPGPTGIYFPPGEIGPAILRPDGSVFATGAAASGKTGHTAIYHPGASATVAGSWTAGPDFPTADDAGDSSAALLVSGNVLVAGNTGALYEFDGTTLKTTMSAPTGTGGNRSTFLLPLPSGQVLVLTPGLTTLASIYAPAGSAQASWAPTVTAVPGTIARSQAYVVSGTQFNGLSQAAAYGDELNTSTNYPLVRITNTATGHVVYARTHGHSTMGVATGTTPTSTNFDVPSGTETGASTLMVIANGIASNGMAVTVN